MFITDWKNLKTGLRRILGLSVFNLLLLFILGYSTFVEFLAALIKQSIFPYIWIGNHSIKSFVIFSLSQNNGFSPPASDKLSNLLQIIFLMLSVLCLAIIICRAYKLKIQGINPYLLLACTISALIIPSVSHDYKLPILVAPMAITLCNFPKLNQFPQKGIYIAILFISSLLYASTLFSYTNKPIVIQNNFPALMVILILITITTLLNRNE